MAAIRTQKEIRQRAPIWLGILLLTNLVIMAFDARDSVTRQRLLRVWVQALVSPAQSISSGQRRQHKLRQANRQLPWHRQ